VLHDFVLSPGAVLGILLISSGKVIEMQNDLVAPGGMLAAIGPMKRRIGVGKRSRLISPAKLRRSPVNAARAAGSRSKAARSICSGASLTPPSASTRSRHSPSPNTETPRTLTRCPACMPVPPRVSRKHRRDEAGIEGSSQFSSDTLGLVVDAFGFVLDHL
jgi:hypothetical protein